MDIHSIYKEVICIRNYVESAFLEPTPRNYEMCYELTEDVSRYVLTSFFNYLGNNGKKNGLKFLLMSNIVLKKEKVFMLF